MFEFVNSGSRANTDNADTLREAFRKINNNFMAISSGSVPITGSNVSSSYALTSSYALNGGGGGGTTLTTGSTYPITSSWSNNSITASYALNGGSGGTTLTTGSTYPITSSWSRNSITASNLSPVSQDLIPSTDSIYSLGSDTNMWKDLYVSSGSIYLGKTVLSTSASILCVNSQPIVTFNTSSGQIQVSGSNILLSSSFSSISSSYALTASYSLNGGGTGSNIYYDILLNNLYDNVLLTYERKSEQLITIPANDYGTQSDGAITISSPKNINTDTLAVGRTVADGISYAVTAITSSTTTTTITVSGSSVTGLIPGDELLLVNLQGDTTYYNNVGNYEFLRVSSVLTNTITFNTLLTKLYGQIDNSTIGNQKVILQRVPNYSTILITSTGQLTANSWNGILGGIVAFRCDTLINSGSIYTDGKGFRFGVGGIINSGAGCTQYPSPGPAGDRGESYQGVNSVAFCSRLGQSNVSSIGNGGGGGGGVSNITNRSGGGGGGGAGKSNGISGSNSSYGVNLGGLGGTISSNTSVPPLIFGGGGGGGGRGVNGVGGNGGNGGGIIVIYANNFNNTSLINSTGSKGLNGGATDDAGGGGGGGGGGVVYIKSNYVNSVGNLSAISGSGGTGGVGSAYGTGGAGGAGGLGNQLLKYTTANVPVNTVSASYETSSLITNIELYPNIEDGFVDNYYIFNTLSSVVSASWDNIYKYYYNVTGSVNSLTSYPISTISSSINYPTIVRSVLFAENNDTDSWKINQDLKLYLSNNGGVSYTTASLIKRGMYDTGKFIYSNDVQLVPQNTASLIYKLEFSSSKVINVYGIGLVWTPDLTLISSSLSSSYALSASYVDISQTASYYGGSVISSSYSITSSYAGNTVSSSYSLSSSYAPTNSNITASYLITTNNYLKSNY